MNEKQKDRLAQLLLFGSSFAIYAFQFRNIFFRLNQVLSSITLDSIKNYYTFLYHTKHDQHLLQFEGMNYPFSEHVVYSDCQPVLTFILKLFPFMHGHLIGTLHFLMFFSFIISPVLLFKILRNAQMQRFLSLVLALAIGLLSPQFLKINAGHFALAYGCIFPISILLQQNYLMQGAAWKNTVVLLAYHLFIFLLHPYMGMAVSLFAGISLFLAALVNKENRKQLNRYLQVAIVALLPIVLFSVFMKVSDTHIDRTKEPFGAEVMVENFSSLLAPDFGPFQAFLENVLPPKPGHFEGHSYLGIMSVFSALLLLVLLPFYFKRVTLTDAISVIFFSSVLILLISFGLHQKVLRALHINSSAVNQFRAVCRFAWVFYFSLPLFVFVKLNEIFTLTSKLNVLKSKTLPALALLFLSVNLVESSALFHLNESAYWNFRNFFTPGLLTPAENNIISQIKTGKYSALLPLPYFQGGSEMYDRNGASASMAPAMMYSYHSGLPIFSVMMSRTSITETEAEINLFNTNYKQRLLQQKLGTATFLVILTKDALLPDEARLQSSINYFAQIDSLQFGQLLLRKLEHKLKSATAVNITGMSDTALLSKSLVYISKTDKTPFVSGPISQQNTVYILDSLKLKSGRYVLSLHYYYNEKEFQNVSANLIVTENYKGKYKWRDIRPLRKLSGFYTGFAVYEDFVDLKSDAKYEFLIQGSSDKNFRISDFLIRPDTLDVYSSNGQGDTTYNNFPAR